MAGLTFVAITIILTIQNMNQTIEIIHCDFDDPVHCHALINLMNEYITDEMGGGMPYTDRQKEMLLEGLKNHPTKIVFLAVIDGNFIGLLNCFVNFGTFSAKPFVNIHDVIVTKSWRNKGIGRQMLERTIVESRRMGCSKVTLEVREDNGNARHLYKSLGFRDAKPKQYYWTKYI
ncbi:MAG: GNAT family N-acetyltransferase [Bacteroidales bacterium]|nr:GNAT family N-acetyltransferase [Bacteroidales bacterium]